MAFDLATAKPVSSGFDLSTARPVQGVVSRVNQPLQVGGNLPSDIADSFLGYGKGLVKDALMGGALEVPAAMLTGAGSLLYGLGESATSDSVDNAADVIRKRIEQNTYQPKTGLAKGLLSTIAAPFEKSHEGWRAIGGEIGDALGNRDLGETLGGVGNDAVMAIAGRPTAAQVGQVGLGLKNAASSAMDAAKYYGSKATAGRIANRVVVDPAQARQMLQNAPAGATTEQALAGLNSPAVPGIGEIIRGNSPDAAAFFKNKEVSQQAARDVLRDNVAGGKSAEESIAGQGELKNLMSSELDPMRVAGAEAANASTGTFQRLTNQLQSLRDAAMRKVEDVRRFTAAGERAPQKSADIMATRTAEHANWMPRISGRFGYMDEIGKKAEQVAGQSADDSLALGAGARTKQYQLDSMDAHGISQLNTQPLLDAIDSMVNKVGDRTNPQLTKPLEAMKQQIIKFSDENGNIDAYDLHGLRKNANNIIEDLYPNADGGTKARALGQISKLNPTIDAGLKAAGGDALVNYFDAFSRGMHQIDQMKMANATRGMSDNAVVDLVRGNSPDTVGSIFKRGGFSENMGAKAAPFEKIAGELETNKALADQLASNGRSAASAAIKQEQFGQRIPSSFNPYVHLTNAALGTAEGFLSKGTLNALEDAWRTPAKMAELLKELPPKQRMQLLQTINAPQVGLAGALGNAPTQQQPQYGKRLAEQLRSQP